MGISDRDYVREERRGGGFSSPPNVVIRLIAVNLVIFFAGVLMHWSDAFEEWGAFTIRDGLLHGQIWRLLTFQFLHANLGHVAFNCIGLWWFGPYALRFWGTARFYIFYLICGAAGAVFFTLLTFLHLIPNADIYTPLVGASAGIYGILVSIYFLAPDLRISLYFIITLTMRQAVVWLFVISVGMIVGNLFFGLRIFENAGGEAGHLGGALMGLLFMKNPGLLKLGSEFATSSKKPKPRNSQPPKLRPRSEWLEEETSEVDRILEKIDREGIQSLTAEDREILASASKKKS